MQFAKISIMRIVLENCSTDDWKFGAEQFVKKMPDKVFVHCKLSCALINDDLQSSKIEISFLFQN